MNVIHVMKQSLLLHVLACVFGADAIIAVYHVCCYVLYVIVQVCECSSAAAGLPHPQCPPAWDGPKGSLLPLVSLSESWAGGPESLTPHLPRQGAL